MPSIRLCAVGRCAGERDMKRIGGGVSAAVADADRSHRQLRVYVAAEYNVNVGFLHAPGLNHAFRAAGALLVGLEEQLHAAGQRVPVSGKLSRGAKGSSDVQIMSAGVHDAGNFRGKGETGVLGDRQGVHIRPKCGHPSWERALQKPDNCGSHWPGNLDTHRGQLLRDSFTGPFLVVPQLRVVVEASPHFLQIGEN